ncbi:MULTISPECIES: LCP family protein [unclassified Gordonia (in: high G+C Gram-positive bacteria)]|uniref:LCP family protein n=1 Tax=unclassified Gordonia (in: high G+C Gram-positive bacteria) TaxID=2657482 RepID=UPI001FFF60FD|nr:MULTISPECIES: LCP family protein [unclassified Gordonia (in: high G+C Gram-positive bacteria)]UQE74287.1 LCP family protein [Gordonia sp. PP30]
MTSFDDGDARPSAGEMLRRARAAGQPVPRWHSMDDVVPDSGARPARRARHRAPAADEPVPAEITAPEIVAPEISAWRSAAPTEQIPQTPVAAPEEPSGHRRPRPRGRRAAGLALRTVVAVGCVGILTLTGMAWAGANRVFGGFTMSHALGSGPRSTDGAENILLMGLDTRRDQDGNPLPQSILDQLHAGSSDNGGYNTNTLILVHIPADKTNIIAYSIPRDDYVNVDGLDVPQAKIKEAYGRRKAATEDQLQAQGVTDASELEHRGREAGRAETIETVRALTGVPIDRFAEVSLVGFYDLAKSLGGVQVCLNRAVQDDYSGANFRAGVQTLNGSQAVAFVRQRHGLDNGDLDRTHRQQAFMLSALHKLQSVGTLSDVGRLNAAVAAAQKDVVISDGWNLQQWAGLMSSVSGQHISFRTLPVKGYATVDEQSVNIIDPAEIRGIVQRAFGVAPTPGPATSTTAVADGGTTDGSSPDGGTGSPTTMDPESLLTPGDAPPDNGGAVTNTDAIPCVN